MDAQVTIGNYMDGCVPEINAKMRHILVDWMIEVHEKFTFVEKTLHISILLVDRYLSKVPVRRHQLQLVGVTSMFISCKYEEILAATINDFVFICDKAYDQHDVRRMEIEMLEAVEFDISSPVFYDFYTFMTSEKPKEIKLLTIYFLNLCFLNLELMAGRLDTTVATCLHLSHLVCHDVAKKGMFAVDRKQTIWNIEVAVDVKKLQSLNTFRMRFENGLATCASLRKKFHKPKYSNVIELSRSRPLELI